MVFRDERENDVKPFTEDKVCPDLLNLQRTILKNKDYNKLQSSEKSIVIFHNRCEQSSYRQFNFDVPGVVDILDGVLVPCGRLEQIIFVERYYEVKVRHDDYLAHLKIDSMTETIIFSDCPVCVDVSIADNFKLLKSSRRQPPSEEPRISILII